MLHLQQPFKWRLSGTTINPAERCELGALPLVRSCELKQPIFSETVIYCRQAECLIVVECGH